MRNCTVTFPFAGFHPKSAKLQMGTAPFWPIGVQENIGSLTKLPLLNVNEYIPVPPWIAVKPLPDFIEPSFFTSPLVDATGGWLCSGYLLRYAQEASWREDTRKQAFVCRAINQ